MSLPPTKSKKIRVPGYCLHKPTGQAYVTLGAKMIYLGKYKLGADGTPDCPEYHLKIAEWFANNRTAPPAPVADTVLTIAELLAQYWQYASGRYVKPDGRPTGELEAMRHALRPVNRLFGTDPAAKFGPKRLKLVRDEMVRLGWARTNINRQISRVKQCFRWGVENELIPGAVDHALRAVKSLRHNPQEVRESEPVRPVPQAAVDAVLQCVTPTIGAMIRLQALTGMRPGELVSMRIGNIEMDGDKWTYKPTTHKNAHRGLAREIPLGPVAREIVRPLLKPTKLDAFLFEAEGQAGTPYTVASYRRAIARACDAAFPLSAELEADWKEVNAWICKWAYQNKDFRPKLAEYPKELREKLDRVEAYRAAHRWHPHQLRHSAATNIRKRFGIEQARVVLGHSDCEMTGKYAEEDREAARAIMEQVG